MKGRRGFGAIAATNPILGVVNFIVLNLPLGWRLAALDYPPTVDKITRIENVRWVVEGEAESRLLAPNVAANIHVRVREGNKLRDLGNEFEVNGHRASYGFGVVRRGLIRKREYDSIQISFYCDVTNRTVELRIVGVNILRFRDELLEALSTSTCH